MSVLVLLSNQPTATRGDHYHFLIVARQFSTKPFFHSINKMRTNRTTRENPQLYLHKAQTKHETREMLFENRFQGEKVLNWNCAPTHVANR